MSHPTILISTFDEALTQQAILCAVLSQGTTIIKQPNINSRIIAWQALLTNWGIDSHMTTERLIITSPGRNRLIEKLKQVHKPSLSLIKTPHLVVPLVALLSGLGVTQTINVAITNDLIRLVDALKHNGARIKVNLTGQQIIIQKGVQQSFLSHQLTMLDDSTKNWFLFTGIAAQQTVMVIDPFHLIVPMITLQHNFHLQTIIEDDITVIRSNTFRTADQSLSIPLQSQAISASLCCLSLNTSERGELTSYQPLAITSIKVAQVLKRIGIQITQPNPNHVLIERPCQLQPVQVSLQTFPDVLPVLPIFVLLLATVPGSSHVTDILKIPSEKQVGIQQQIASLQKHDVPVSINADTITVIGRSNFIVNQALLKTVCTTHFK